MPKHDYHGEAAKMSARLTRMARKYSSDELPEKAAQLAALPKLPLDGDIESRLPEFIETGAINCHCVDSDNVLWVGTDEGLWRIDESERDELDRFQCFRASAYLADNCVKAVESDKNKGIWVLTQSGISHIKMRMISAEHKANLLSEVDERFVQRRGMLSGAVWSDEKNCWLPRESDNDGLWTALVAMGDICRYAVMKNDPSYTPEEVERARKVATRWTETLLLLEYLPAWKGRVAACVRYNEPGTNRSSKSYLKYGREGKIKIPENGPTGFVHAPLGPADDEDWAENNALPEIVFRNIEGYIARSYHVNDPENDPVPYWDGVFFKKVRDPDGKMLSVRIPTSSDKGDDLPDFLTIDSSYEIPERLRRLYTDETDPKTGRHWQDEDIIYKCDTSNDELTGHYAVWQLAYDILGEDDPELREMISVIAERHAKHIAENGYAHTDAGGQPTSWARMTREYYLNRDCEGYQDGPLGTMILLQLFKVAHHVTGNERWNEEYRKLALEEPYRYADFISEHYERYENSIKYFLHDDTLSSETMFPMVVKTMNYSDTRMAAVAYYTISQLEDDPELLEKYRKGADCWWRLEKYGRDVEWSLVYQLMHPDEEQYDAFGRPCKDVLAWQLSRFPISQREIMIDNTTRSDAYEEDGILWYKDTETMIPYAVAMDERGGMGTDFFTAKQGSNRKILKGAYNMIMPYWIGRYNGLISEESHGGDVTFAELSQIIENQ